MYIFYIFLNMGFHGKKESEEKRKMKKKKKKKKRDGSWYLTSVDSSVVI